MAETLSPAKTKANLRLDMREVRQTVHKQHGLAFAEKIREHFIQAITLMPQTNFSCYYPIGAEVNVRPIMETLDAMGHVGSLPVIVERDQPLIFRRYKAGDPLQKDKYGIPEPLPYIGEIVPDVLLIPMMGYGPKGDRLGYGTGFFDRTLEQLRAKKSGIKAIGLAYSAQLIKHFPSEGHDQRMDMIVTELGIKKFRV